MIKLTNKPYQKHAKIIEVGTFNNFYKFLSQGGTKEAVKIMVEIQN